MIQWKTSLAINEKKGFSEETYSHKNPEKCDGQVGARQQSVHVERDNPSEHGRDPHDHLDHLSETFFSDYDCIDQTEAEREEG